MLHANALIEYSLRKLTCEHLQNRRP